MTRSARSSTCAVLCAFAPAWVQVLAPTRVHAQPAEVPILERAQPSSALRGVVAGIDVLRANNFDVLRGMRVGLVTNQTGVTRGGESSIDVLFAARRLPKGPRLTALFGPEHGIRGVAVAGAHVRSGRDARTGLPIYSLYGSSRRPSPTALKNLDAVVFDMQEIGSRSYTYISTLGEVMAACAKAGKLLVVLDRPNPIGGERIEGSRARLLSFVSPYPIPYCHGLTIGELARLVNGRKYLPGGVPCRLRVVPMLGYARRMTWPQNGLPWVRTSPNIPRQDSPYFYAATGIVGELSAISIGIGTDVPFQVAGAPGVDARRMASELSRRRLPGLEFRPVAWKPSKGVFAGRSCRGVQVFVTDTQRAPLTRVNFEIMDVLRRMEPARFASRRWFVGAGKAKMFDMVCGTDRVRRLFLSGADATRLWEEWNREAASFRSLRRPYLQY
jgi:uncharacterized protein YbbC (DUF1343 family)